MKLWLILMLFYCLVIALFVFLLRLQECFPGNIHMAYIIKPGGFWEKQRTSLGSAKYNFEVSFWQMFMSVWCWYSVTELNIEITESLVVLFADADTPNTCACACMPTWMCARTWFKKLTENKKSLPFSFTNIWFRFFWCDLLDSEIVHVALTYIFNWLFLSLVEAYDDY